jgi:hypothetical protein
MRKQKRSKNTQAGIKDMHIGLLGLNGTAMAAYQATATLLYKKGWEETIKELGSMATHGNKNTILGIVTALAVALYLVISGCKNGKGCDNSIFQKENMKAGLIALISYFGTSFFMEYLARISNAIVDSEDQLGVTMLLNVALSTLVNFLIFHTLSSGIWGLIKPFRANFADGGMFATGAAFGLAGGMTGGMLYDLFKINIDHQPEYALIQGIFGGLGAAFATGSGLGLYAMYQKCCGTVDDDKNKETNGLLVNNEGAEENDVHLEEGCCPTRKQLSGGLFS